MVGGDGERVGEHRWRSRKLATGSFGREDGWRRGLRGRLAGGGGHGGGDGRSRAIGTTELGARAQEGRREGWGRLGARGIGLGGQEREKGRGAVVRVVTASPWRFGSHPR